MDAKKTLKATLAALLIAAAPVTLTSCASGSAEDGGYTATETKFKGTSFSNIDEKDAEPVGEKASFVAAEDIEVGERLATAQTKSWQIDVYTVGTAPIEEDSGYLPDEENPNEQGEALIKKGTEMVYLNFVYTNISGKEIGVPVGLGLPEMYSDTWDHDYAMPSDFNFDAYESFGISMPMTKEEYYEEDELPVEAGEAVARGYSAVYEPGVRMIANIEFPTVNDEGTVVHDGAETATVEFTVDNVD